jgi:hypothetical protein
MVVGGHADNNVDLCGEDNADTECQYLGKGQGHYADNLFWKTLVTTTRMGQ